MTKLFSVLLAVTALTLSLAPADAKQSKRSLQLPRSSTNADPIDFKTEAGRQRFWQNQSDRGRSR